MNFNYQGTPLTILVVLFASVLLTGNVGATNGYFSHGYGTQTKALAGAGAALPQNSLAAATNPAGMVNVGSRYDIGVSLFNPSRQYTIDGNPSMMMGTFGLTPGTIESGTSVFVIPSLGANWMIDEKSSLGLSIYGNGGMNTTYKTVTFYGADSETGVDLMQAFVAATYARKLAPNHSVGVTGIFAYQRFKATGLQAFSGFSSDAAKLTSNGYDNGTGFGARVGYLGTFTPGLSFGVSYQTKMAMSEFSEYAGLFAEEGGFDIPANWTVGVAVDVSRKLTLVADFQQILYSDVKAIANPLVPADFQAGILLGSENGSGFGWEDMNVIKLGLEWNGIPQLPLRLGFSHGEQPIPGTETMFNILAPGVIEQHITFGFSRELCGQKELSFAVTHALSSTVTGTNPMEVPDQQEIELKMHQWDFEIGFSF